MLVAGSISFSVSAAELVDSVEVGIFASCPEDVPQAVISFDYGIVKPKMKLTAETQRAQRNAKRKREKEEGMRRMSI